jgi:BirA family transcriptional regulator, biotin operon repressor / biotin---[acetyl-CoA-carboxylase] ligase
VTSLNDTGPGFYERRKIRPGLILDWQIHRYQDVASTNDVAAQLAERGAHEGCVVVAEAQSAGRGRHGRAWASPPGAGLYVSAVLRPTRAVAPLLTIAAGVSIAEGIQAATGLQPCVKWPNDVYVGARKLAGILAEAGATPAGRPHVVLGFGINVMPAAFPPNIAARATSIEDELGRAVDRELLLASCLERLASRYADLQQDRAMPVLDAWRARAAPMLRRTVEWDRGHVPTRGIAEDIDDTGALLIRTEGGVIRVFSGEVRWL